MWGVRRTGARRRAWIALVSPGGSLLCLAATVGASCGPVTPPAPSGVAVNACPPDACGDYIQANGAVCSAGQCISNGTTDFTLIVSMPEETATTTSLLDPSGVTIAIPRFLSSYLKANACNADLSCVRIPPAAVQQGSLSVDGAGQVCAGRPNEGGATLAAYAEFYPLWASAPATATGLPLLPVPAHAIANETTPWSAVLGPATGSGAPSVLEYEEYVVPLDPNYPPVRLTGSVPSGNQIIAVQMDIDECTGGALSAETTFSVSRGNGSLAGFTVYVRDTTSLQRVSSLATLSDASMASVTLLTAAVLPPSGWASGYELVVAPPAGAPFPTYADPIPPVTQLGNVNFPPLPPPLTVTGTVVDADGSHSIEADLVIDSTPPSATSGTGGIVICSSPACTTIASGTTQRPLAYSTTAHSDRDNGFSVALPAGTYDVFVVPAVGEAAGATSVPLALQYFPTQPPVAGAKTLTAAPLATIEGSVTLADGRVLVGAEVEAHAAVSLAAALVDPRRWPRTVLTTTDAVGHFSMTGDPGTYDIVVRPQRGTGFPWMTVTSQAVNARGVLAFVGTTGLVVPAPIFVDMTLQDATRFPLSGAIVRAYAPPSPTSETQVDLGSWLTDANGHFSMFLAPPR